MLKACSKCGTETEMFGKSSRSKDGYRSQCKPCEKTYEETRTKRDWPAERAAKTQDYRRCAHYRHRYGITLEEYDNMLAVQGGRCAICSSEYAGPKGRFHVDHDHETQEIRGLLCHGCNTALGHMRDSTAILESAIQYLEDHGL